MELFFISILVILIAVLLCCIVFVLYAFLDYELFKKLFFPFNHRELVWRCNNIAIVKVDRPYMRNPIFKKMGMNLFQRDFNYNGYVAFKASEIPEEWHGNYKASGLEILNIHGGITYAQINVVDKKKETELYKEMKKAHDMLMEVSKRDEIKFKAGEFPTKAMSYLNESIKLQDSLMDFRRRIGYDWVVFGFDCAHSGDDENPDMGDLNYIIKLTVQMRDQMIEFAKVWNLYMATESDKARAEIIDSVRSKAEIRTEMGLGGLLNLMMGKI